MNRWRLAIVFASGLVCALAILALARLADEVSAKRYAVVEAQPPAPDFDWREVRRARAVRIPDSPPPSVEVRVGEIPADRVVWSAMQSFDELGDTGVFVGALASGPGILGLQFSDGNGFRPTARQEGHLPLRLRTARRARAP